MEAASALEKVMAMSEQNTELEKTKLAEGRVVCFGATEEHPSGFTYSGDTLSLSLPKWYSWDPQPDITVYELARCMPILVAHNRVDLEIQAAPPEVRRHFKEVLG